jgi:hypothetical protein
MMMSNIGQPQTLCLWMESPRRVRMAVPAP